MSEEIQGDISQTELLESNNSELQKKIHTSLPARIVSFDSATQTATIELLITQMDYDDGMLDLPPLVDVPVQMFSYGEFFIAAEPQVGDEGMAYFSERCIDGWWESGEKSIPMDVRFHDLSDAHFVGGTKSKPNALTIIPNALSIGGKSAYIRIKSDGTIEIKGDLNISGNITTTGTIQAVGNITGMGVSLATHTHMGVQSGNSSTLPPTPTGI